MPPVIEVLQMILAALAAGFVGSGWMRARQYVAESLVEGAEPSLVRAARWQVSRAKSRFFKLALVLFSGGVVLVFRWKYPDWPITPLPVYGTRNGAFLAITLLIAWDEYTDYTTKQEIVLAVREERKSRGRRKDDVALAEIATAHIEGIVTVKPDGEK